jgi:hypothetical protein
VITIEVVRYVLFSLLLLTPLFAADSTVLVLSTDGRWLEGNAALSKATGLPANRILSLHNGAPASASEAAKISAGLAAIQGTERAARDQAVEELTGLGLAALTPLLDAFKDTDQHEPRPLYRLFERLIPSVADSLDRSQSLFRLIGGETRRGSWPQGQLTLKVSTGNVNLAWSEIRLIAVRRKTVRREFDIHSLRHSTQIEYLDTGLRLGAASSIDVSARGFARLAFKDDSWASGPNGLSKPGGNYTTNLVDGHPFGALLGRISAQGTVFFVGQRFNKNNLLPGRLQLAVNDNRHWQNNLGSYRVSVVARDVYDLGEPQ